MHGYTPGEQVVDCTKLNTNESCMPPSPMVMAELARIEAEALRLYPQPRAIDLRRAAAARYGIDHEWILAGNGSDDCLTVLYRAFLAPGERVACPWPSYGLYDDLATLQGAEIVHVDYRREAGDWHLPSHLAKQAAKLVIVANPNNPSATLTPVDQLRQLAHELDGVLVVDEAYVDFSEAELGAGSILPFLERHPNLVVLRTFSKSYAMAGARLGLLFAHPEVVAQLMKVKDSYNVNAVTQRLGIAALADRDYHQQLCRRTVAERLRLEGLLAARCGWTWPQSRANFTLFHVGPKAGELYLALKAKGLLVRWWDRPALRDFLRITVGTPEQTDRLMAALTELT